MSGNLRTSERQTQLPVILCFHGAGTNGTIFQLQARKIIQELGSHFQFVFITAPFEALPGPGVLGIFDSLKPFYRWHCDHSAVGEFDLEIEDVAREQAITRSVISEAITTYGCDRIAGTMSFSQGTRVATALCLDGEVNGLNLDLAFAIVIAGTFPVLPLEMVGSNQILEKGRALHRTTVSVPSVHVQGSRDPWLRDSVRLMETYYEVERATVLRFNGAHQVPTAQRDAEQIAKVVMTMWTQAQQDRP